MHRINGLLIVTASDLTAYLECGHLVRLECRTALGEIERPGREPVAALFARKGAAHEQRFLDRLREEGHEIIELPLPSSGLEATLDAARRTEEAMARGAEVIAQATLFDGERLGRADVLRRTRKPSERWPWSYEVVDAKLALTTQPAPIVQLCFYSEHVERLQGSAPRSFHVVLGDGALSTYSLDAYSAYYRALDHAFREYLAQTDDPYPIPVSYCDRCAWSDRCAQRRDEDDHLSLVARMRGDQIGKLEAGGITTIAALARASDDACPARLAERSFSLLRRQAALQTLQREAERSGRTDGYRYELLLPQVGEGFALMPPSSPGDVFFDMEGDPLYEPGRGLEYLFGNQLPEGAYVAFWALAPSEERAAFEQCVDFFLERRERDPRMHVYHYAPYEKSALRRLAATYETREEEVDALLRADVFVDLYAVVRQALLISQPSYSIKKLEPFYGFTRATDVRAGDDSILAFEQWRMEPEHKELLHDIQRYNEDDCRSTYELRLWLDRLKTEAERTYLTTIVWAGEADGATTETATEDDGAGEVPDFEVRSDELEARLLDGIELPDGDEWRDLPEPQRDRWLLAKLLGYHRREEKPAWWEYFDRCENADELIDEDSRAIGGLVLDTTVEPFKATSKSRNLVYTYRFPPQQFFLEGDPHDPHTRKTAGKLIDEITLGEDGGRLCLQVSGSHGDPAGIRALIPGTPIPANPQRKALQRLGAAWLDGTLLEQDVARELLARRPPRRRGMELDAPVQPSEADGTAIADVIASLDASALFVQGPPGTGKTTRGAAAIVDLIARGLRIGITARSHAAIDHLLNGIDREAQRRGLRFCGMSQGDGKAASSWINIRRAKNNRNCEADDLQLVAGTAWLFAREEMMDHLDVLVVDEAGQIALADALAVSGSARNLVFLGDPLQLQQVSHGTHPSGTGDSVLEYLLGDAATIPPDRGIFLDVSYRMHPEICAFISENVYDGRLRAAPATANNAVESPGLRGSGLRYMPISHVGNGRESSEEAEWIVEEVARLLRGSVTLGERSSRAMTANDVLVVSPYNAQRARIERILRARGLDAVRVGTVDKFQGQEAPVVFYSMATSSDADLPRDLAFLYERNRFNVAISRAQALCVLVASPKLLRARCKTPEEMAMVNLLCRYVERSSPATQLIEEEHGEN
jgi:predicted RecB family nuclease